MANNVKAVLNEMMMTNAVSKDAYARQGGFGIRILRHRVFGSLLLLHYLRQHLRMQSFSKRPVHYQDLERGSVQLHEQGVQLHEVPYSLHAPAVWPLWRFFNSFYAVPGSRMPRRGCCCDRDGEYGIKHERCASFGVNNNSLVKHDCD